jgi:23S rRNA-/tRNA-specific pseudouridylate synthase
MKICVIGVIRGFCSRHDQAQFHGITRLRTNPDSLRRPLGLGDGQASWLDAGAGFGQSTTRNLQAAINSSIAARDFWARTRSLKFLRYVHRLDADTSGVLLFAKSRGAVEIYSKMFESRQMEKKYLAVASGRALDIEWTCQLKLAPDPGQVGRVKVDARQGKPAETRFRLLQSHEKVSLIEACPVTGRTHQIRVHLAEAGLAGCGG